MFPKYFRFSRNFFDFFFIFDLLLLLTSIANFSYIARNINVISLPSANNFQILESQCAQLSARKNVNKPVNFFERFERFVQMVVVGKRNDRNGIFDNRTISVIIIENIFRRWWIASWTKFAVCISRTSTNTPILNWIEFFLGISWIS